MKDSKYNLSQNELKQQLQKQIVFLERSCTAYDSGHYDEACRIATTIRVLIHDTKSSVSLLQHLQLKNKTDFWDSADQIVSGNLISTTALVSLKIKVFNGKSTSTYEPKLENSLFESKGSWQGFQHWWPRQVVAIDKYKVQFTRKELVLLLANQDGGAHVDEKLSKEFADLLKFNSIGWQKFDSGITTDFDNNFVYASVRQIGFEVLKSIKKINL